MNYSVQQRVFMYDSYVKYSSWKKCVQKFSQKYPGFTLPSKSTIYRIVRQVHRTGTVLDKKRNRRRHVLTEEVLDDIGAQLEANPNISMRKVASQCGVSKSSAHVARILLNKQSLDCEVRSWSTMNAQHNKDNCVSADLLQDKTETQTEPPAEIADPREHEQSMTDVKMSPVDSIKVYFKTLTQ
ncbi:uncharacterized protein LOC110832618 [Zootermopsis nevadensis]|uniref:DUF4817 domain-containing protein n=1 Tax=Zootermopsis nevadensis TaxID=136037 RepID=A0A067R9U2_ZOONE|nr:uncharacterized protein LOC110832618 [Zootermopsis nevadensis]KDR16419.1 hypothetical protein L798_09325 [Zootermopsis nevadensis]